MAPQKPRSGAVVVEDSKALVPAPQQQISAIPALGSQPEEIIKSGERIATALVAIVKRAGLVKRMGNKDYVMAEGWATCGAMLSVFPQVVWTKRIELKDNAFAWEARVELVTRDGSVVGAAEAIAASNEVIEYRRGKEGKAFGNPPWAKAEFSVRSMSQTRATGKAFRLSFSWIMTLAGFQPTPAEEMPDDAAGPVDPGPPPEQPSEPAPRPATGRDAAAREVLRVFNALYSNGVLKYSPGVHTPTAIEERRKIVAAALSQVRGVEVILHSLLELTETDLRETKTALETVYDDKARPKAYEEQAS